MTQGWRVCRLAVVLRGRTTESCRAIPAVAVAREPRMVRGDASLNGDDAHHRTKRL